MLLVMMVLEESYIIGANQCLFLPKAELNTKSSTKWPPIYGRLVEVLVFNSVR